MSSRLTSQSHSPIPPSVSRAQSWTIADVLDFESLLSADADVPEEKLRERDRAIFEEKIAPKLADEAGKNRPAVFREWLEARRAESATSGLGERYITGWQSLLTALVLAGLALGASIAAACLRYRGPEPINAIEFIAFTLGPQWLFLAAALL